MRIAEVGLVSVNVGKPAFLGTHRGKPVQSGIAKRPVTEDEVRVGDRWSWGEAVLEVCQPRWPCYKLAIYRGSGDVGPRMRATGRTGWYLRVLQAGRVPVRGPMQ